jgi:hypothetical protein
VASGPRVTVQYGTANVSSSWLCTAVAGGTLATTAINFRAVSTGNITLASTGLTVAGNIKLQNTSGTLDLYQTDGTTWNGGLSGSASTLTVTGGTGGFLDTTSTGALVLKYAGTEVARADSTGFKLSNLITTVASTTGGAGITLPHGTSPSSPVNGDIWTTTSGFYARLNGVTSSFAGTNTGDQTTITGQAGFVANAVTWNNSGTGAASGATFNGSAPVTISYNTIGAAAAASPTFTGTLTAATVALTGDLTISKANPTIILQGDVNSYYPTIQFGSASFPGLYSNIIGYNGLIYDTPGGNHEFKSNNKSLATIAANGTSFNNGQLTITGPAGVATDPVFFSDATNYYHFWYWRRWPATGSPITQMSAQVADAGAYWRSASFTFQSVDAATTYATLDSSGITTPGYVHAQSSGGAGIQMYDDANAGYIQSYNLKPLRLNWAGNDVILPGATFNGTTGAVNFTASVTTATATADTSNTQLATTAFVQNSKAVLSVPGLTGGTVNLTAAQAAAGVLIFTGTLTGNVTVNFSSGSAAAFNRAYTVVNNTSGAFTFTLQACATSPSNSVSVAQSTAAFVMTNGASIILADWAANQATFNSAAKGVVPASGGGTTNFLRADGTFVVPVGSTTNSLTFNNAGSGAASGATFTGATAQTISYNTIGAAPTASPTFTGTATLAAATLTGILAITRDSAQTRYMLAAGDKGWRVVNNGTGTTDGQLVFQHSTDAFATNFTNALTLNPDGSSTFGSTVTVPAQIFAQSNIIVGTNAGGGNNVYLNGASGTTRGVGFQTAGVYAGDISLQTDNTTILYNSNGGIHKFTVTGTESFQVNGTGASVTGNLGVTGTITASTATNGVNGTTVATTAFVQNNLGTTTVSTTGGTVTLTQDQASAGTITITGTLTSNVTLNLGSGSAAYFNRLYCIFNNTSGAFTVTVQPCVTSPANSTVVQQASSVFLYVYSNTFKNAINPISNQTTNPGLAPAATGSTTNFLRADGTWNNPLNTTLSTISGWGFSVSGARFGTQPMALAIQTDGGIEAGNYIDLHETGTDTSDFGARIQVNGSVLQLTGGSGTSVKVMNQTLWVNSDKLLLQHDGSDGYIRSQAGRLFLGAGSTNYGVISAAGLWQIGPNNSTAEDALHVRYDVSGGPSGIIIQNRHATCWYCSSRIHYQRIEPFR